MWRRDLALVLGARITWLSAAAAAVLIGHGFVLAIDLYTAASRSVADNTLLANAFDPLLGIVRPTLGGLYLASSLFAPLIGARAIAIEKDRRTFATRLLATGSAARFVAQRLSIAVAGSALPWLAAVLVLALWRAAGGHLALGETAVALFGHLAYVTFATAIGLAAGALTRGFAQAATASLLVVAFTWAIDAAEGYSALAWLGGASAWSPSTHLRPFEDGTFALGAAGGLLGGTLGALGFAIVGCRFDWHGRRRTLGLVGAAALLVACSALFATPRAAWDLSEGRRRSLPSAVATELAKLPGRLALIVNLDREDSRRVQFQREALGGLRLARPDLQVRFPPDEHNAPASTESGEDYGQLEVRLDDRVKTTTSTSPHELATLAFELAGRQLPDWTMPVYTGYPLVLEGTRRAVVLAVAYVGYPVAFLLLGLALTTTRRRST